MTPGRLLYLARREWERGVGGMWHYHRTLRRILDWRCPVLPSGPPVPVHVLTGQGDWMLCLWMLASWHAVTGLQWKICLHDDGSLGDMELGVIHTIFPSAQTLSPSDVDGRMASVLEPYPLCASYRAAHPLGRKIFDVPVFAESEHLFLFDSDVLFFVRPDALLEWASEKPCRSVFNRDVAEGTLVSTDEALKKLGVSLQPRVNSGLVALHTVCIDLALCEQALALQSVQEGPAWRVEQTLFALCASGANAVGTLPSTYEVSLGMHMASGCIARHYVGAVRNRFFAEGLPLVHNLLQTAFQ